MAYNKNLNQTGWFYHAPAKPKHLPPVDLAPTSQIPGLSDLSAQPEEPQSKKGWIKETDSKYIQLAKQGGRPDLLRFRSPKPKSEEARGYPRCEWFYLEDNALEDAEKQPPNEESDHEFLLPEYMVHHAYKPHGDEAPSSGYTPNRVPFGQQDKQSAFQREQNPTDKTKKLPELKHEGHGIRGAKLKNKPVKHTTPKPDKGKVPKEEMEGNEKKYKPVFQVNESEQPIMSKIMSYGYQKDWNKQRDEWESEQQKYAKAQKEDGTRPERVASEYQQGYKSAGNSASNKQRTQPHKTEQGKLNKNRDKVEADKLEKELFKLSKFKNVAARTNSHPHRTQAVA